jgi:hypothetical protein
MIIPQSDKDASGQATILEFIQNKFSGGMNRLEDSTQVGENEYPLLINGRNRLGTIKPIPKPVEDMTGLPSVIGKIQGLYTAANYGLVFADGKAFYKDYSVSNSIWNQVAGLQMDAGVDVIYIALVESSTINYVRKLDVADEINGVVNISGVASSTPRAVVVQDGISQPWIILPDATARQTKAYGEWSQDDREYVPIGTLMVYDEEDAILYVYDNLRKLLYRSVSGRPLDFVVNIDTTGNKGGDATTTAHAVSFETVTGLQKLNVQEGGFFVSTPKVSYRVVPDFTFTVFGEPVFTNRPMFTTGVLNQFSTIEALGDTVFIDYNGIVSFNAVELYRNEGRNSPFSQKIAAILEDVQQDNLVCAGKFDNYVLFSVKTIYGPAVIVYDELRNVIVALDMYAGVERIVQFAEIKTPSLRKLLFRTSDNKVYEAFADTEEVENLQIYIGDWSSINPKVAIRPNYYKLVFQDATSSGTITAQCYVDGKAGKTLQQDIVAVKSPSTIPVTLPFGDKTSDSVQQVTFDFSTENQGWKIGLFVSWSTDVKLSSVYLSANSYNAQTSWEQQANISKKILTNGTIGNGSKNIF